MIWQISVAVIAAAFVVLVVFVVKTLKVAEQSLDKTTQTLQEIQTTVDELSHEVKQVVRQANSITMDVEQKMKQLDPVLESVKNVGDVLSEVTLAAKQISTTLISRVKKPATTSQVAVQNVGSSRNRSEEHIAYEGGEQGSKTQVGWMKWVDIAADVWQRYRS